MTGVEGVVSLAPNLLRPCGTGRPHLGSVGPRLFATSSHHVILSETTPGFGHDEDMYGFWSIWYFSVIRYSWNCISTKLVSNRHLCSISCMKCRYVGGKYMHFMTANTPTVRALLVPKQRKEFVPDRFEQLCHFTSRSMLVITWFTLPSLSQALSLNHSSSQSFFSSWLIFLWWYTLKRYLCYTLYIVKAKENSWEFVW
jgi:hypothetical protein